MLTSVTIKKNSTKILNSLEYSDLLHDVSIKLLFAF